MDITQKKLVNRGEVKTSSRDTLGTQLSTCVAVCLYHTEFRLGGISHISRSRKQDKTLSEKHLKTNGYYYADNSISRLVYLLKQRYPAIRDKSLEVVVAGGLNNEGPVSETLAEIDKVFQGTIPTVVTGKNHKLETKTKSPKVAIPFKTDFGSFTIEVNLEG